MLTVKNSQNNTNIKNKETLNVKVIYKLTLRPQNNYYRCRACTCAIIDH